MRILQFISFSAFVSANAWAIASNGFIPRPQGKVTAEEKQAILLSIQSPKTECIYAYAGDGFFNKEWEPEIFDAPYSCGQKPNSPGPKPAARAMCAGTVVCHAPTFNFVVEKAMCWASDGTHCPPPSKCVAQSFLKSFSTTKGFYGNDVDMPVYITTEPARSAK